MRLQHYSPRNVAAFLPPMGHRMAARCAAAIVGLLTALAVPVRVGRW